VVVEDYRQDYNRYRPHRAHGMMTPQAFKTGWETAGQLAAPLPCSHQPTTSSHSRWTDERGPVQRFRGHRDVGGGTVSAMTKGIKPEADAQPLE
jgi:hypothetical protein